MKIFECGNCSHIIFFENHSCEICGHLLGFDYQTQEMRTFDLARFPLKSDRDGKLFRFCANQEYGVCNWVIPVEKEEKFCVACSLNRTIPDLSDHQNFAKWEKLEVAKHRLVYQLNRLKLPIISKLFNQTDGICFDFLSRDPSHSRLTGHANGVITILLDEADSVHLEKMKSELLEPYRTLIGHFRHEVGHYYWDLLIYKNQELLREFRLIFGDERTDYAVALKHYYQSKDQSEWRRTFISQYASAHPWEDWAETWAHYLHIMAMAETAYFFRLTVHPNLKTSLQVQIDFDPYQTSDFETIFNAWLPVSFAINSLNRSMGIPDAYPFVINPAAINKMKFIHRLLLLFR